MLQRSIEVMRVNNKETQLSMKDPAWVRLIKSYGRGTGHMVRRRKGRRRLGTQEKTPEHWTQKIPAWSEPRDKKVTYLYTFLWTCSSQSMAHRTALSTSPGNLMKMQIPGFYSRLSEKERLRVQPSNILTSPPRILMHAIVWEPLLYTMFRI